MLDALTLAGVNDLYLDIGHVGVFGGLMAYGHIAADKEAALFQALQAKDTPAIRDLTPGMDEATRAAFIALPTPHGGVEVLDQPLAIPPSGLEITPTLEQLAVMSNEITHRATLNIPLA